jgi:hypothetical protein
MDERHADVALMIAGDPAPEWLEKALSELSVNVGRDIHNAEFISRPLDVRDHVEKLKKRAVQFEKALNKISKSLLDLHSNGVEDIPFAQDAARKMIALCDATLSVTDVKRGAPTEPGRVICALIVIEAWAAIHGKPPSANNQSAQEVCDKYWIVCGCKPIISKLANWTHSIKVARRDRTSRRWRWVGEEMRRRAAGTQ